MEEDYLPIEKASEINEDGINFNLSHKDRPDLSSLYTIEAVLEFLQFQWSQMSTERSHWEMEKAELTSQVSNLQSEVRTQENMKKDLVRRVKMLEFSVKQERAKNNSCSEPAESSFSRSIEKQLVENEEKRFFLTYLQRMGINDSAKISKLKELMGLENYNSVNTVFRANKNLNASNENSVSNCKLSEDESDLSKIHESDIALEDLDAFDALAELDSNLAQHVDHQHPWNSFSKPSDNSAETKIHSWNLNKTNHNSLMYSPRNPRSKLGPGRLDLLVDEQTMSIEETELSNAELSDELNLGDLASLTCTNHSDRLPLPNNSHSVHSSKNLIEASVRAKVMDSIDGVVLQNGLLESSKLESLSSSNSSLNSIVSVVAATQADSTNLPSWEPRYSLRGHFDSIRQLIFHPNENHVFTVSDDCTLKLWNLAKGVQNKKSLNRDVEPWYTFHGHTAPVLCCDLWINTIHSSRHKDHQHENGGVFGPPNSVLISGSLDGTIRTWCLPQLNQIDSYETFNPRFIGPVFSGHSSAVWAIKALPRREQSFLSMSCDGNVKLWPLTPLLDHDLAPISAYPFGTKPANLRSPLPKYPMAITRYHHDYPVSNWISNSSASSTTIQLFASSSSDRSFACGFSNGQIAIVSLETSQLVSVLNSQGLNSSPPPHIKSIHSSSEVNGDTIPNGSNSVYSIAWHPYKNLLITAHEDKLLRIWDPRISGLSGPQQSWVAHLDAVTSVAISEDLNSYICSASHDSSIRFWSLEQQTCIQELNGQHRFKYDEGIHCVAFHSAGLPLMGSSGADGVARVYESLSTHV